MRISLVALALHVLPFPVLTTTPVRGEDSTTAEAAQEPLLSGKELIPHLAAFEFEPWYELDEFRLWRHIGWKVRLQHLPDNVDAFVDLMRSEQFREHALDIDWQLVASLGIDRLAELPNIESINVSGGIPVTDVQLGRIARLPRLRQLNIAGQSDPASVFAIVNARPAALKQLNLVNTQVRFNAVRALGGFWRPGRTGKNLPGLPQLTDLDLHSASRDSRSQQGVSLGPLSSLRHLRRLGIGASELQSFDDLGRLTELRVLDLHDRTSPVRRLEDSHIMAISRLANLRVLRLSLSPTAKQLRLLRPLTRLEQIDVLADGHPTDEFRTLLSETLPSVKTTVTLTALGDQAAFRFEQAPLKAALQLIASQYAISVHLDTQAVKAAGISADEPVDGEFTGMTLGEVLTGLVGELNLKMIPHAGVVTVTSHGTQAIWEREHDLSPLLEGLETPRTTRHIWR